MPFAIWKTVFMFLLQISLYQEVSNNNGIASNFWKRLFFKLPNGIHRVNITGHRDTDTASAGGLLIDDISTQACSNYCKIKDCWSFFMQISFIS